MNSRITYAAGALCVLLASISSIASAESIAPPMVTPAEGQTYFTRHTFHYEKGKHLATNYSRGQFWPINTEVRLSKLSERRRGSFELTRVDTGEKVTVENVPNFTQVSVTELASRMLADQRTPIERLSQEFQTAINAGQLRLGMTREEAIMARGYPPGHETPSLDLDVWKYWVNRFAQLTIVFEDGVIVEGRGLR